MTDNPKPITDLSSRAVSLGRIVDRLPKDTVHILSLRRVDNVLHLEIYTDNWQLIARHSGEGKIICKELE